MANFVHKNKIILKKNKLFSNLSSLFSRKGKFALGKSKSNKSIPLPTPVTISPTSPLSTEENKFDFKEDEEKIISNLRFSPKEKLNNNPVFKLINFLKQKHFLPRNISPKMIVGVFVLLILFAGTVAAFGLSQINQDVRQQACIKCPNVSYCADGTEVPPDTAGCIPHASCEARTEDACRNFVSDSGVAGGGGSQSGDGGAGGSCDPSSYGVAYSKGPGQTCCGGGIVECIGTANCLAETGKLGTCASSDVPTGACLKWENVGGKPAFASENECDFLSDNDTNQKVCKDGVWKNPGANDCDPYVQSFFTGGVDVVALDNFSDLEGIYDEEIVDEVACSGVTPYPCSECGQCAINSYGCDAVCNSDPSFGGVEDKEIGDSCFNKNGCSPSEGNNLVCGSDNKCIKVSRSLANLSRYYLDLAECLEAPISDEPCHEAFPSESKALGSDESQVDANNGGETTGSSLAVRVFPVEVCGIENPDYQAEKRACGPGWSDEDCKCFGDVKSRYDSKHPHPCSISGSSYPKFVHNEGVCDELQAQVKLEAEESRAAEAEQARRVAEIAWEEEQKASRDTIRLAIAETNAISATNATDEVDSNQALSGILDRIDAESYETETSQSSYPTAPLDEDPATYNSCADCIRTTRGNRSQCSMCETPTTSYWGCRLLEWNVEEIALNNGDCFYNGDGYHYEEFICEVGEIKCGDSKLVCSDNRLDWDDASGQCDSIEITQGRIRSIGDAVSNFFDFINPTDEQCRSWSVVDQECISVRCPEDGVNDPLIKTSCSAVTFDRFFTSEKNEGDSCTKNSHCNSLDSPQLICGANGECVETDLTSVYYGGIYDSEDLCLIGLSQEFGLGATEICSNAFPFDGFKAVEEDTQESNLASEGENCGFINGLNCEPNLNCNGPLWKRRCELVDLGNVTSVEVCAVNQLILSDDDSEELCECESPMVKYRIADLQGTYCVNEFESNELVVGCFADVDDSGYEAPATECQECFINIGGSVQTKIYTTNDEVCRARQEAALNVDIGDNGFEQVPIAQRMVLDGDETGTAKVRYRDCYGEHRDDMRAGTGYCVLNEITRNYYFIGFTPANNLESNNDFTPLNDPGMTNAFNSNDGDMTLIDNLNNASPNEVKPEYCFAQDGALCVGTLATETSGECLQSCYANRSGAVNCYSLNSTYGITTYKCSDNTGKSLDDVLRIMTENETSPTDE